MLRLVHQGLVASTQISLGSVAAHHALAVEARADAGDGLLHHPHPASVILIPQGQDRALEFGVELRGMLSTWGEYVAADCPTSDALLAGLRPPAVEDAEIQDPVQRRLHAAGAGGLQRR